MQKEDLPYQLTQDEIDELSVLNRLFKEQKPLQAMTAPSNYASTQYDFIKETIQTFEASLDLQHEVGMRFTNFGQSTVMRVMDISYHDPVLFIFKGYVDDKFSTLIRHISQLNFLLMPVPITEKRPKRKISFAVE